ncbi:tRNA pseudouridine(38-40) synthase TruA [Halocynthiibacter sp. C4]|uniref:tRNA pseudouridine(38-40) synthase TruA n=1 Tax=Halocynthiibacter sp. C4 TaxID=2992758 RepID=UPI00237A689C|nr:tRNA pseudouridine(38-40) synthase TruA [Halocynthiibacter sp. C4]MDE0588663.1 tRNA pseudouridine(38-40) synthase TruA [Halocynthiibacter sp. C4]
MPRYALKIEYNGAPFSGWQRQKEHPSVQQAIEEALQKLDRSVTGIAAAGRTDTGVHATGQVAHVDMAATWEPFRLAEALNYHLKPNPVAIVNAAEVDEEFHARFSAIERRYLFRLISRRAPMTFDKGTVWHVRHELDADAMQEGANFLLGRHDFTTFRSTICQAPSPLRTLDELRVERIELQDATEYRFHVRARAFLHNQVRSFVGTLERVGAGSWQPEDVAAALEAKDRAACGPVCPPHGLYLAEVKYPQDPFKGMRGGEPIDHEGIEA